jgi:hypothetical protein
MRNAEFRTLNRNTPVTLHCPIARYRNTGLALESSSPVLFYTNILLGNFNFRCLPCCLPHKSSSFCVWAFNLDAELCQDVFEAVEQRRLGAGCLGEGAEWG